MNFEKNRKYFFPSQNTAGIVMAVIGAIVFLGGAAAGGAGAIVIGLLLLAGGIAIAVTIAKNNTKGVDLDNAVNDIMQSLNIKQKALRKLGLDEDSVTEIEPVICDGYYFKNIRTNSWFRRGEDGVLRSSNYQVSVLFFSAEQVYSYSYAFSLVGKEDSESTDEYFYRDIVSASTSSDQVKLNAGVGAGNETANFEYFKLTTSGGTSISMSIRNANDPDLERKINGMKQLLRQKKSQQR